MRTLYLLLAFVLTIWPALGHACQTTSGAEQVEHDAVDLDRQRKIIKDLVAQSEFIVVARATSASAGPSSAHFVVIDTLKGTPSKALSLSWKGGITVSCHAADSFQDVSVKPDQIYLLYVMSGLVLRAGSTGRRFGELPYAQEVKFIHAQLGA